MPAPQLLTRVVVRDNMPLTQAECPGCGRWEDIDQDQLDNKTSIVCPECHWHGYVDGRTA